MPLLLRSSSQGQGAVCPAEAPLSVASSSLPHPRNRAIIVETQPVFNKRPARATPRSGPLLRRLAAERACSCLAPGSSLPSPSRKTAVSGAAVRGVSGRPGLPIRRLPAAESSRCLSPSQPTGGSRKGRGRGRGGRLPAGSGSSRRTPRSWRRTRSVGLDNTLRIG
jgi:hypothetical protein